MWSALVDLAMTPEEQADCGMVPSDSGEAPRYPWGLKLRLGKSEIEKLGLPLAGVKVGDLFDARIFATVTSISMCQRMDGTDDQSVELQIEKMALESETAEDDDD